MFAGSILAVSLTFGVQLAATAAPDRSPKARALEVYKAFKNKDWNRLFDLSALPGMTASNRDAMRKGFVEGIAGAMEKDETAKSNYEALVSGMSDMKTGAAVVKGNLATVPTSSVVKIKDQTLALNGRIILIKQGGDWKGALRAETSRRSRSCPRRSS
jgi:hypothetical protein